MERAENSTADCDRLSAGRAQHDIAGGWTARSIDSDLLCDYQKAVAAPGSEHRDGTRESSRIKTRICGTCVSRARAAYPAYMELARIHAASEAVAAVVAAAAGTERLALRRVAVVVAVAPH